MIEPSFFEWRFNLGCWMFGFAFQREPWVEFNIHLGPLMLSWVIVRKG